MLSTYFPLFTPSTWISVSNLKVVNLGKDCKHSEISDQS